ncbi:MAG: carboxypeptidase regulatory-like domain-containing protein [Chitinophagaceae bacterium]|nr:carboxypeptidase regulatory-like domain-containing protein [Chitinophagaceae bacterium]
MKYSFFPALFILIITALTACQREINYDLDSGTSVTIDQPQPVTGSVQGVIIAEDGLPLEDVVIKVGNKTALTDENGHFRIDDALLDKQISLLSAEMSGYFTGYRTFRAGSGVNYVTVKLIPQELTGSFEAASGGTVSLAGGTSVQIPAAAIVREGTQVAYTGNVNVYMAYINPLSATIDYEVPGSFLARNGENNVVWMTSFGMVAVELSSPAGEKLQLASGKQAQLTIPIPSGAMAAAPSAIPYWHFNEAKGIWEEEGSATRNGQTYTGAVSHFSFWNADIGMSVSLFQALVNTTGGKPLSFARVRVSTTGEYATATYGYTDSAGMVRGYVLNNRPLLFEVLDECDAVIYSQPIGPYNNGSNASISVIVEAPEVLTIKGKVVDCQNSPLSNAYVEVYTGNVMRQTAADPQGNFSIEVVRCANNSMPVSVIAYDPTSSSNSPKVDLPFGVTDAGEIRACGVSSLEFFKFTLDGQNYEVNTNNADTIFASSGPLQTGNGFSVYAGGGYDDEVRITVSFETQNASGPGTLEMLSVMDYLNTTFTQSPQLNLTNFPQTAGEYFEGTFNAQFQDNNNQLHSISCTFRLRRR